jgi:hypothetical protein
VLEATKPLVSPIPTAAANGTSTPVITHEAHAPFAALPAIPLSPTDHASLTVAALRAKHEAAIIAAAAPSTKPATTSLTIPRSPGVTASVAVSSSTATATATSSNGNNGGRSPTPAPASNAVVDPTVHKIIITPTAAAAAVVDANTAIEMASRQTLLPRRSCWQRLQDICTIILARKWFIYGTQSAIVLNTLILAVDYYGMNEDTRTILDSISLGFTVLFVIELVGPIHNIILRPFMANTLSCVCISM